MENALKRQSKRTSRFGIQKTKDCVHDFGSNRAKTDHRVRGWAVPRSLYLGVLKPNLHRINNEPLVMVPHTNSKGDNKQNVPTQFKRPLFFKILS